jgi:elongator complex protein 1
LHFNFTLLFSYYCDNPDILFDTAIGTYDLNLASLVADCLGKDPKEYLPVLDGFQNLSHHRRLFKIDERLRRFSKAIIHLIDDESVQHDEVLKYMERHRLFSDSIEYMKTALGLPELASKRTRDDMSLLLNESRVSFGRYLEEHGRLKEACILYRGGGEADKAINSAVKCGSWETALEIFFTSYSDPEKLTVLCGRILEQLEESKVRSIWIMII